MPSSTHPIFSYAKEKIDLNIMIKNSYKSLNVDNLSNDFKTNIGDYLFLQNQKDKFI